MAKTRLAAALLLALPLFVFGGNFFAQLFELPTDQGGDGTAGEQLLAAMRDGGLMTYIAMSHIAVAVLLVLPRTRFAGALLQLPISLGILAFHVTMLPAGNGIAIFLLALNLIVLCDAHRIGRLLRPAA